MRKEFMLHDRANWPVFAPPRSAAPRPMPHGEPTVEEEEDVSRGDLLDFMSPRDFSRLRYEQHHEWMEEVFDSPYPTKMIIPTDLGLGRKGELESLTNGFFDAPVSPMREASGNAESGPVGKMDAEKAEEFATRAAERITQMQAELDGLKRRHAHRMQKLRKTANLGVAERALRNAPHSMDFPDARRMSNVDGAFPDTVDDIVTGVEDAWNKRVAPLENVALVERGGLQEPTRTNGEVMGDARTRTTTSGNVADSPEQNSAQASQSPMMPQPPSPQVAREHSASVSGRDIPPKDLEDTADAVPNASSTESKDGNSPIPDLDMDVEDVQGEDHPPQVETENSDWVMVDEQARASEEDEKEEENQGMEPTELRHEISADTPADLEIDGGEKARQQILQGTPSGEEVAPHKEDEVVHNDGFDMEADFDNVDVDTAGDALADYGGDEDDLNLEAMDDSAFGDAFHSPEDNDDE